MCAQNPHTAPMDWQRCRIAHHRPHKRRQVETQKCRQADRQARQTGRQTVGGGGKVGGYEHLW